MHIIDSHCHLTDFPREELDLIIERAFAADVQQFICVSSINGDKAAFAAVKLAEEYPFIFATLGIHPEDANNFFNLSSLEVLFNHPKVVAIGETGLDFYWKEAAKENQEKLFRNSIAVAKSLKKPIIIHSREALEETLTILKEEQAVEVGGVFHCYSGDSEFAKKVYDIGFYISFAGNVTFKKALQLQEAVKKIPIEQLLVETDSPYLAPVPYRGKRCEPAHTRVTLEFIAKLKNMPVEEVAKITTENTRKLFEL